jgi:secondary thiamine-phosphate synthase enzyme
VIETLRVETAGQGLYEITRDVAAVVDRWWNNSDSAMESGLCTLFIRHTSASLTIQENADPSARRDLEAWLRRLVPEGDPHFTHTTEGADDMPAHIKAALTATSLGIPVLDARMVLGTWQGIYLWEHRERPHRRDVVVHLAR